MTEPTSRYITAKIKPNRNRKCYMFARYATYLQGIFLNILVYWPTADSSV